MRILYIAPGEPIAPDYSGASSRYYQNFAALTKLYDSVDVIRLANESAIAKTRAFEVQSAVSQRVFTQAKTWQDIPLSRQLAHSRFTKLWRASVTPVDFEYEYDSATLDTIAKYIDQSNPTLIWVEQSACAAPLLKIKPRVPWILSQTDVGFHVQRIRQGNKSLRLRWSQFVLRRAEAQIFRAAPLIVSGSYGDAERTQALGAKRVTVIPMAYEDVLPAPTSQPQTPTFITHLGSLETTSNRVGLEAYLRKVQPFVQDAGATLMIIGDHSKLKDPLLSLLHDANAVLKGFLPNLSQALRPFDISILPYEYDSGYRTKLPVLFNHAQVVVTTKAAIKGMWVDGIEQVCVVLDRLEEFPDVITRLIAQPAERERLGRSAYAFYAAHFTLDGVFDQYRSVIDSIRH